jgi:hypothetical protein
MTHKHEWLIFTISSSKLLWCSNVTMLLWPCRARFMPKSAIMSDDVLYVPMQTHWHYRRSRSGSILVASGAYCHLLEAFQQNYIYTWNAIFFLRIFTLKEHKSYSVLSEIVDHWKDRNAILRDDTKIQGTDHLWWMTKGWPLLVKWKDGSSNLLPSVDLKESYHPVHIAEHAYTVYSTVVIHSQYSTVHYVLYSHEDRMALCAFLSIPGSHTRTVVIWSSFICVAYMTTYHLCYPLGSKATLEHKN